ncbi:MAG: hypothetical protein V3T86_17845 [Planctomycetota bacterium]
MSQYKITGRSRECAVSGKPFEAGQRVVSVISLNGDEFVRRDLLEDHFEASEDIYSYWVSTVPEAKGQRKLDLALAREFLRAVLREQDPKREGLAYALTLLLARKRRVKTDSRRTAAGEVLTIQMPGDEEDEQFELRVPRLEEEEVVRIQDELTLLLEGSLAADPTTN